MGHYASCYFSPGRGAVDVVIGFIDRCEETLDVAVYSFTHDRIAEALIRARARGVKIRVLMDTLQASSKYADDEKLEDAHIEVRRDTRPGAMHNKFMIGDSNAAITGSFNWTVNAAERNAENFVIIRLLYVVRAFQTEFDALWAKNV